MKRLLFILAMLPLMNACRDMESPTQPPTTGDLPGPSLAISDAAHDGLDGFWFLPPLVSNPNTDGPFNPDISPVMEVWDIGPTAGPAVLPPACVAGDRTEAPFPVTVFRGDDVVVEEDHYKIEWDTGDSNLDTNKNYQLRICVGELELGFADVDPAATGKEMKNAADEVIPLKDGRTLPVKFFVTDVAFGCEDPAECIVKTITQAAGGSGATDDGHIAFDVDPGFLPQDVVDLGITEVTFNIQPLPLPCLDQGLNLPLQERDQCVRGETEPDLTALPEFTQFETTTGGDSKVRVGMCFDDTGLTPTEAGQFQGWSIDETTLVQTPLRNLPDPSGLDCSNFPPMGASRIPIVNLARATWRTVTDLFRPSPLAATHRGNGNSIGTFSRIVWARSLIIQENAGNNQSGAPGATLPNPVEVKVTTPVNHLEPGDDPFQVAAVAAVNVPVTFVPSGDGSVGSSVVNTDGLGLASTSWTLPTTGTSATLEATAAAIGSPVTFTASVVIPVASCGGGLIDGINSPGEWAQAAQIQPSGTGSLAGSTVYVTSDSQNLCMAIDVPDATLSTSDNFEVRFDNANDDVASTGDDEFSATPFGLTDTHFNGFWGLADTQQDGVSAGRNAAGRNFIEVSKPLNSGDSDDFSLTAGQIPPFCVRYFLDGTATGDFPFACFTTSAGSDQSGYLELIDFETPAISTPPREISDPYTDATTGVIFTAEPSGFGDEVIVLAQNQAGGTSACADPTSTNQKLATWRSSLFAGGGGGSDFPIRATFPSPLSGATVAAEFQVQAGQTARIRLFDGSATLVGSSTVVAGPASGTCGNPGLPRARSTVTVSSTSSVAYAILDGPSGGFVFVIDNFIFTP
jgi:hypothetical protein